MNGYTFTVNGDVWLGNGTLNINKGKLYVGGDLNLSNTNKNYYGGYLTMQNDEDYILVGGNMFVYSYNNSSKLVAGTIEIKGNFTQKNGGYSNNFYCSSKHNLFAR